MAARKEILSDLSSKIADGNIRDAYRTFEDLPVVDQIAVSISPGVGDALAAYEIGEFGSRAKTNIEDRDYLGAAGNIGLSALSGISLIPLFRFLRGARGVTKSATKSVDAPTPKNPPTREPLQLAPPKIAEAVDLPEIVPFNTRPATDLAYQTTQSALPLQSKARKFLHGHYKKIDPEINELSPQDWVKTLTNPNNEIPLGELRLLNVLDELNEIHPKLIKEATGQEKITKQGLDNYMQDQQLDALQIRGAPPGQLQSPDTTFVNDALRRTQQQKLYHVRGAGEQRTADIHYRNLEYNPNITGNNAYVFDGIGDFKPLDSFRLDNITSSRDFETIKKSLEDLNIQEADNFASIFRVQSDFMKEANQKGFLDPKKQAQKIKDVLRYNKFVKEINPILAVNTKNPISVMDAAIINKNVRDVGVEKFTIEPKDIEKITGRSYKESLDKTPEEIFYMLNQSKTAQKYIDVPNNPEALSQAYFKDLYSNTEGFLQLQNGARILKQAVLPKMDFTGKFKIDPYFEKTTSNEMKLPVRANVLQAYKSGKDGIHIGPAQAIQEGAGENIIEKYTRGEKEIQKILNELGLGNKKKELTTRITGTNTEYDGTYLKFSNELKRAIEEQGINAFKLGGPVEIDRMLAEL